MLQLRRRHVLYDCGRYHSQHLHQLRRRHVLSDRGRYHSQCLHRLRRRQVLCNHGRYGSQHLHRLHMWKIYIFLGKKCLHILYIWKLPDVCRSDYMYAMSSRHIRTGQCTVWCLYNLSSKFGT